MRSRSSDSCRPYSFPKSMAGRAANKSRRRSPVRAAACLQAVESRVLLSAWTLSTLAKFTASNGAHTYAPLAADAQGNLYGTTPQGGAYNNGTVFEIAKGTGAITTLVSFNGANRGAISPETGVVLDAQGNLYGTTEFGGQYDAGIVFEIAKGTSAFTTLASLNGYGIAPDAGLTIDPSGNLYWPALSGPIMELAKGAAAPTVLASMTITSETFLDGPLLMDAAGNLYGTEQGGPFYGDSIYEVVKGSNAVTYLAKFGGAAGAAPLGRLAMDAFGNIYGQAAAAGNGQGSEVFELPKGSASITDLASFVNIGPQLGGVTIDPAGNLYGVTHHEGSGDTLFELAKGSSTLTTLVSASNVNGALGGAPIMGADGNIYGTSIGFETHIPGTVFELTPNTSVSLKLTSGTNPSNTKKQLTYTATVTGGVPDGQTVLLADESNNGSYLAAGVIVSGTATLSVLPNSLAGGEHELIAAYTGNPNYAASFSAPLEQTIVPPNYRPPSTGPTPPVSGSQLPTSGWTLNALASFTGSSPNTAYSPLTVDAGGNVFGTTQNGGTHNQGSVFEIAHGSGAVTTLASFNGANGGAVLPQAGVVLDAEGNLYGTTEYGGQANQGIVFEIAKGSNTVTTLVSLSPAAGRVTVGLTIDSSGNLYAPTATSNIIEVAKGTGALTVLARFNGVDGTAPASPLLLDAAGNLYGSTQAGGAANKGTIFEVARGSGQIIDLASFTADGHPAGALAMDTAGNIYGTARTTVPTIFKFTRSSGTITDLVALPNGVTNGVAMDAAGDLYTNGAGPNEVAAVFEFIRGSSTLTSIATFPANGNAVGAVTLDSAGNVYGIASAGYDNSRQATAFELTPDTALSFRLTSGTNPANANQQLTYTANITGGIADGETVLLEDASNGNAYIAAGVVVNGTATLTILPNTLSVGPHKLIVVYNGDGTHATSYSTPLVQTIFPAGYRPPRTA